jgi:hypothetical protein
MAADVRVMDLNNSNLASSDASEEMIQSSSFFPNFRYTVCFVTQNWCWNLFRVDFSIFSPVKVRGGESWKKVQNNVYC